MWSVIPVAGRASRLAHVARGRPKALLEVGDRSILDWLLCRLAAAVTDVCLVVDDLESKIPRTMGRERHGVQLHYALQPAPLGVGDAVLRAASHVTGPFVVVMGDVFYDRPLDSYVRAWRRSGADGAVLVEALCERPAHPVGLAEVQGGFVSAIEKAAFTGQARYGVCGMAILPEVVFEAAGTLRPAPRGEVELEDIIGWLIREREARFLALPYHGWRRNINTPVDLALVRAKHASQAKPKIRHA